MYFWVVKNDHFFEKRKIAIFGVDFYKLIYLHRNQNFYIIHRNDSDLKICLKNRYKMEFCDNCKEWCIQKRCELNELFKVFRGICYSNGVDLKMNNESFTEFALIMFENCKWYKK